MFTPVTTASISAPAPAPAEPPPPPAPGASPWPRRNPKALAEYFGRIDFDLEGSPREQWVNRFTQRFDPPWPCVAPWDNSYPVRNVRVHTAVAGSLHRVLGRLLTEFGAAFIRQRGLNILAPNVLGYQPGEKALTPASFGASISFNPGAEKDLAEVGNPFQAAAAARAEADTAAKAIDNAESALRALEDARTAEDPEIEAADRAANEAAAAVEAAAELEKAAKTAKEKREAKEASEAALARVTTAEERRARAVEAAQAKRKPAIDLAKEKVRSAYRLGTEAEERAAELERLAREAQEKGLEAWAPPSVVIDAFREEGWTWAGPDNPGTFFATSD